FFEFWNSPINETESNEIIKNDIFIKNYVYFSQIQHAKNVNNWTRRFDNVEDSLAQIQIENIDYRELFQAYRNFRGVQINNFRKSFNDESDKISNTISAALYDYINLKENNMVDYFNIDFSNLTISLNEICKKLESLLDSLATMMTYNKVAYGKDLKNRLEELNEANIKAKKEYKDDGKKKSKFKNISKFIDKLKNKKKKPIDITKSIDEQIVQIEINDLTAKIESTNKGFYHIEQFLKDLMGLLNDVVLSFKDALQRGNNIANLNADDKALLLACVKKNVLQKFYPGRSAKKMNWKITALLYTLAVSLVTGTVYTPNEDLFLTQVDLTDEGRIMRWKMDFDVINQFFEPHPSPDFPTSDQENVVHNFFGDLLDYIHSNSRALETIDHTLLDIKTFLEANSDIDMELRQKCRFSSAIIISFLHGFDLEFDKILNDFQDLQDSIIEARNIEGAEYVHLLEKICAKRNNKASCMKKLKGFINSLLNKRKVIHENTVLYLSVNEMKEIKDIENNRKNLDRFENVCKEFIQVIEMIGFRLNESTTYWTINITLDTLNDLHVYMDFLASVRKMVNTLEGFINRIN
ncbi:hypothetical protein ROZALSC1DRAFT_30680, partial [Rozella allomycis CSF55]